MPVPIGAPMKIPTRRPALGASGLAVFLLLSALAGTAQAQWAWRDANGNITYSDAPPPSDVRPSSVLRQPEAPSAAEAPRGANSGLSDSYSSANPAAPAGDPAPAPGAAEAPRPVAPPTKTLAEQEADFRKRAADREKAAQKAEQDEAKAAERAAACTQAQGYLQMIQSGARLMRPDAEGNRNFMDEDQRAAEVQKTQETIAKTCT
jgi:hypothetical protein